MAGVYEELKDYFRLHDPQHLHEKETFLKLGYMDVQNLADRIKGEVLMGVALMDTVCPPSTQFAAFNIKSVKNFKIFPDFGHEGLPGFNDITMQFLLRL